MKMKLSMNKQGFVFQETTSLNHNLLQQLLIERVDLIHQYRRTLFKGYIRNKTGERSKISFDWLLHNQIESLTNFEPIQKLKSYGVNIEGLKESEQLYQKRKKKHDFLGTTIEEYIQTEHFKQAVERVKACYNGELQDGSTLFNYQFECAALILGRRRLLNAMDVGLGKTRTSLAGVTADPRNKKILIVTMSRNLFDWKREIKILGLENDYIVLNNPSDMKSPKRIHLVSYEKWARETIKFKKIPGTKDLYYSKNNLPSICPSCGKDWNEGSLYCTCGETVVSSRKKPLYKYFNRSYKAAIVDEGHLIKNGSTSKCKSIMAIKTPTRVLLTGTPVENSSTDLYWLLSWLIGDWYHFWNKLELTRFETYGSFGERCFRQIYGGVSKKALIDSNSVENRTTNVSELWHLQDIIMYRKKKQDKDVKEDIRVPKPIHRRIHLQQTEAEKELYSKVLNDFAEWFEEMEREKREAKLKSLPVRNRTIEICSWLNKLRLVTSCPWIFPDYNNQTNTIPSKLEFVRNKMKQEALRKRKMLLFTAHKKTCEELAVLLSNQIPGYEVGYIHGEVSMEMREELLSRFQDPNDSLSLLILTMRTGAESYTLTQAKSVILWDLDYNPKKIEQCFGRAVRMSQKDVVEVTWLINVDTIEVNMHSLILSKQSSIELVIDREELDFKEIAAEFEGHGIQGSSGLDYEEFAKEMLKRGTTRKEYERAV